jgi:hypothetical protein
MMQLASVVAVLVVVGLAWNLYRRFGADHILAFNEKRRTTSRLVSRGEFIDGTRRLAVALAVTKDTLFYENNDMRASIDLQWVREIDYDTELATGAPVEGGRVLRLRSNSQTFEFILPQDLAARWYLVLPPRREQVATLAAVASAT